MNGSDYNNKRTTEPTAVVVENPPFHSRLKEVHLLRPILT